MLKIQSSVESFSHHTDKRLFKYAQFNWSLQFDYFHFHYYYLYRWGYRWIV